MDEDQPHLPSSFSAELLQAYSIGLQSDDYRKQWNTFDQMVGFTDFQILPIIQDFLRSDHGDPFLKTNMLQQIRRICPWPIELEVCKGGVCQQIKSTDVPLEYEEWPEFMRKPYERLERIAHSDPALLNLAKQSWQRFIEAHYPFAPPQLGVQIGAQVQVGEQADRWAAALHDYTLHILYDEDTVQQIWPRVLDAYQLQEDEVKHLSRYFF